MRRGRIERVYILGADMGGDGSVVQGSVSLALLLEMSIFVGGLSMKKVCALSDAHAAVGLQSISLCLAA